jgi:hypothetical protein
MILGATSLHWQDLPQHVVPVDDFALELAHVAARQLFAQDLQVRRGRQRIFTPPCSFCMQRRRLHPDYASTAAV